MLSSLGFKRISVRLRQHRNAMPWSTSLLLTALIGIVCGSTNGLVDQRLRGSYTAGATTPESRIAFGSSNNNAKSLRATKFFKAGPTNNLYTDLERRFLAELWIQAERQPNKVKENTDYPGLNIQSDYDAFTPAEDVNLESQFHALGSLPLDSTERSLADSPLHLPVSLYNDFYQDLLVDANKKDAKRGGNTPVVSCDCKVKNDLLDLGQQHFPRYLLNSICYTEQSPNEYPQKCWRGSFCKPLEYKVKVLTFRSIVDHTQNDPALAFLPEDLRKAWRFKTVTVAAGCLCSY